MGSHASDSYHLVPPKRATRALQERAAANLRDAIPRAWRSTTCALERPRYNMRLLASRRTHTQGVKRNPTANARCVRSKQAWTCPFYTTHNFVLGLDVATRSRSRPAHKASAACEGSFRPRPNGIATATCQRRHTSTRENKPTNVSHTHHAIIVKGTRFAIPMLQSTSLTHNGNISCLPRATAHVDKGHKFTGAMLWSVGRRLHRWCAMRQMPLDPS